MRTLSDSTRQQAQALMEMYPTKEAAMLPVLHLAQKEFGLIDDEAEQVVAEVMGISPVSVRETSRFYFMYHHHPVGKYHLQVCQNISCTIMGAETILDHIKRRLGIEAEERTEDGLFSVERVECIACCDRGPAMLVNDKLHTGLTPDKIDGIIKESDPERKLDHMQSEGNKE
ncbi:NAD(P)H-dependent oxidoreductase subunit E [candidate division LCP-89 bacterium B3_LCP]|uniref:NAD(P)H-dependent oxidoreductase subunit E n=1 Tax=candidate division LCP-89 bacterium B3_LCP TaxID=2012998 RepID=A0A532V5D4_UNCL8|nr:MAG: NAD(P)H-dependent oxidoreductase subunit E [candidate division LCP-89 bacterium B3_LCP]